METKKVVFRNRIQFKRNRILSLISVAEPEPVERQHFVGARPNKFWLYSTSGEGYVNSLKMLQNPTFFKLKLEVESQFCCYRYLLLRTF
jgi:hypothetical protein